MTAASGPSHNRAAQAMGNRGGHKSNGRGMAVSTASSVPDSPEPDSSPRATER